MKILIAVDFSPVGREVAHAGYKMAKKMRGKVTFFHCAPQTERFLQGYDIKALSVLSGSDYQKRIEEVARHKLHKIIEDVKAESGSPEPLMAEEIIAFGEPGEEIIEFSAANGIDLIMVGYKSYSAVERILVGSTAAKVARHAPCSVLIYRPSKR